MVMSPQMIQEVLLNSAWSENQISNDILVPCLQVYSRRNGFRLRDVRFTGGASELGNDIEYYELLGPDLFRFYTGIQVKKGDISQAQVSSLVRQGDEAFEKNIADVSSGQTHRISRWIIATLGSITDPAQREIGKRLERYGKPVHFWDGLRIGAVVMEYYYREFIEKLQVDPIHAASNNLRTTLWDPDQPIVVAENFHETTFSRLDTGQAAHEVAAGLLLTVRPRDRNLPSVRCLVRSRVDEVTIDSVQSQLQPYILRMEPRDCVEAMLLDPARPVDILARGFLDIL